MRAGVLVAATTSAMSSRLFKPFHIVTNRPNGMETCPERVFSRPVGLYDTKLPS